MGRFGLKMKTSFHNIFYTGFVIFCYGELSQPYVGAQTQGISISAGSFQEISISAGQSVPVSISGVPAGTGFSVIQAHVVLSNITISFTATPTYGQSATGSNVGLVLNGTSAPTVYLINDRRLPINVLLSLQSYDSNAPIPGGCNMELPIKTAPFLPSSFTPNVLTIEYPLGSWPSNVRPATCDRAPLEYSVYIYYLPERDFSVRAAFDGIRLMSNVTSVEKYGIKVNFHGTPPSKLKFANYAGTGRIVAVLLRTLTTSSAYVPTLSYGCSLNSENSETDCEVLGSTGSKLLSAWLVFAGLFLTSLGHRYYKCQLFLFGFLVSAVLFYVILMLSINIGSTVAGTTATVAGAVGGAAWVTIWAKCGTPIGPVFLASFILGSLVASITSFTPLADLAILKDDLTFWLAFFCIVLTVPLIIVSFDKLTSILVSCIVGAYVFTAPVNHFVGSNLEYIFLNVMRRATDRDFTSAIIQPPYQTLDIILTITWAVLALIGLCFQWWRERDRAPFPPAPGPWNWPTTFSRQDRDHRLIEEEPIIINTVPIPMPTETTPLITH